MSGIFRIHKYAPTAGDVHNNRPLTQLSEAFLQEQSAFASMSAFPTVSVQNKSDTYYKWKREDFFRDDAEKRSPGTEPHGGNAELTTGDYNCDIWEWSTPIPDEVRNNADSAVQLDQMMTEYVMQVLMIRKERLFATNFLTSGKWTTDISGADVSPQTAEVLKWSKASSDPVRDVEAAKKTILLSTGKKANKMVIGYEVLEALRSNAAIIDRLKYGQTPGSIATVELSDLQQVFGLPIVVSEAVYNTAKKGQDLSTAFIAGKVALVCHAASTPGLRIPSAGYNFAWNGMNGMSSMGTLIRTLRLDSKYTDRVDGFMSFDMKLTAADLGYLFTDIV